MANVKGKVIGAIIGTYLAGPIGAVIGAMVGHYFHDTKQTGIHYSQVNYQSNYKQPVYAEFIFTANLVALLTAVAKVDGEVTRDEVAVIRKFFQYNLGYRGEQLQLIKNLIKKAIRSDLNVEQMCEQFYSISNYHSRLLLVKLLYMVAFADNSIRDSEQRLIEQIAQLLSISAAEHQSIKAEFVVRDDTYYQILGIKPGASAQELKQAYRTMVKNNHPDKVAHLGEEYTKIAHERLTRINEAYTYLSDKVDP